MTTVAVIGSGASGLVAIKTCIDEGLKPVCFERSSHIGGVWHYSDDDPRSDPHGPAAVYHGLHTNIPKEFMAYSDFPMSKDLPPFPKASDIQAYYKRYADHFDIWKHIHFNTAVISIDKAEDYDVSGRWTVTVRGSSGEVRTEVFDAVLACTGVFSAGNMPEYPGLESFRGKVMHSCQVKRGSHFTDKTVLIVGSGTSGGDTANIISHHASQVYLSLRKGAWCIPRFFYNNHTLAEFLNQRWKRWLPSRLIKNWIARKVKQKIDCEIIGIQSSRPMFGVHPMADEDLPGSIMEGRIRIRTGVDRFDGTNVHFMDGSVINDVDFVIFATGYELKLPFFKKDVMPDGYENIELYLHMFPLRLPHTTLAFVGFALPFGAGQNMSSELQARYVTKVLQGGVKLPSFTKMQDEIVSRRKELFDRFGNHFPYITNTTAYFDHLAREIGALPNAAKLILTDPVLAYYFYFKPTYPPSYRLVGPGAVPGARQALIDSRENLVHGIAVGTVRKDAMHSLQAYKDSHISLPLSYVVIGIVLSFIFYTYFF